MNANKQNRTSLLLCFIAFLSAFWVYYFILKNQGAMVFFPAKMQGDYFSIDWKIMQEHFWSSLLYYHAQLPFYLFYTYLFEHVFFPPDGFIGHYILNTLAGIGMVYSVYRLQVENDVNRWLAAALIICYVITPSFYANYSMGWHDYLTSCLLAISAYLFYKAVSQRTTLSYFYFFMMLALIGNIRALYHPIMFYLPIIVGLLIILRSDYKKILVASLIPTLLIFAPYVKNKVIFDTFNVSTHSGRIMVQTTYEFFMSNRKKVELVQEGKLSELAFCIHPADEPDVIYQGIKYDDNYCEHTVKEKYANAYISQHPNLASVPILKAQGSNYLGNIGYNQENTRNAFKTILYMPREIGLGMREKWRMMFKPNITYYFGNMGNVRHFPDWMMSYNGLNVWPGQKNIPGQYGNLEKRSSLILVIAIPLLVLFALTKIFIPRDIKQFNRRMLFITVGAVFAYLFAFYKELSAWEDWTVEFHVIYLVFFLILMALGAMIVKIMRRPKLEESWFVRLKTLKTLTFLYIVFLVLYTTIFTTILVGTEHQRYRQYIDPLLLVLLGTYLTNLFLPIKRGE